MVDLDRNRPVRQQGESRREYIGLDGQADIVDPGQNSSGSPSGSQHAV